MAQTLRQEVEQFQRDTGLSDHRVGFVLARNGRLLERLRDPRARFWEDTKSAIRAMIKAEREKRGLDLDRGCK